jgi:hypothetical protein
MMRRALPLIIAYTMIGPQTRAPVMSMRGTRSQRYVDADDQRAVRFETGELRIAICPSS